MTRLCTILARGGSKGLPNKNLKVLNGRTLVERAVSLAKETGLFDLIVICSDCAEITKRGLDSGADLSIPRPAKLADDSADKGEAIAYCALQAEIAHGAKFDLVVDLDVTAPIRNAEQVKRAVEMLENSDSGNLYSACRSRRSPYFNMVERQENGDFDLSKKPDTPIYCRQDVPDTFDMNSAIFAWKRDCLQKSKGSSIISGAILFEMPEISAFDIDNPLDWEIIKYLDTIKEGYL